MPAYGVVWMLIDQRQRAELTTRQVRPLRLGRQSSG